MIRINLLPNKKKKKSRSSASIEGDKVIGIGFGAIAAVAAGVFFFVHMPLQDELESLNSTNKKLKSENKKIEKKTENFDELKAAFEAAEAQVAAIRELNNARATPAFFLHELAELLRSNGKPTMTAAMSRALEENENLRWQEDWEPKHLWIDTIEEANGNFTLTGFAQSDGDANQLAHRMHASAYFSDV